MSLLVNTINNELDTLMENNISLSAIGNVDGLPTGVKNRLDGAIRETENNDGLKLILALNYSGRWDIQNAIKGIIQSMEGQSINSTEVSTELIEKHLSTSGIPDPELVIRTSGEQRMSNFYLWQSAYTEFHFTEIFWPDFRKVDLFRAVEDFQKRERRFGKTSEQVA